jgi:hypothetical protein
MKKLIAIVLLLFASNLAVADNHSALNTLGFTAVCQSDEGHAFRYDEQLNGDTGKGDWNTDETFFGDWIFDFDGTKLTVDGKSMLLLPSPPSVLIAVHPSANNIGGSLWAYVIHLEVQKIGAAQVHGYTDVLGGGIKARVIEFDCVFE